MVLVGERGLSVGARALALPRKVRPGNRRGSALTSTTFLGRSTTIATFADEIFLFYKQSDSIHIESKMDSLGASGMSAFSNDPKTQVMRQVQQEAAMQNARMLVEVCLIESCCI